MVVETYKNPIVGLMEVGLVAAFLFHALNGIRVILVDFWSKGPRYQRQMTYGVLVVWVVADGALLHPPPVARRSEADRRCPPQSAPPLAAPRTRAARAELRAATPGCSCASPACCCVVLVFGHLFVNLMVGEGINAIDFAFVAGKWANPFWQVWDLSMLWLADAARHERPAHDHQRLRDEADHPLRAQDAALLLGVRRRWSSARW